MQRKLLLSTLAAVLIAGGGMALAQTAPSTPAPAPQATPMPMHGTGAMRQHPGMRGGMHGGMHGGMRHRMGRHHGPAGAVIGDLRQMSRLYIMDGKIRQLEQLYKDVLGKTQNPMVRTYVSRKLARLQARPRDTGAALATLRRSLDENLKRLNAMPAPGMGRGPGPKR